MNQNSDMALSIKSYRESFGLQDPGPGTEVQLDFMAGMDWSVIWPTCPDDENILAGWIKKKADAEAYCQEKGWVILVDHLPTMTEDTVIVINFSGGKDSSAMLAHVCEKFPNHKKLAVMADTGWEHPGAVEWARGITESFGLPLHVVRNEKKDFMGMVRSRKKFPSSSCRQCTSDLKRDPIHKWIRNMIPAGRVINCLGERAAESPSRAKKAPISKDKRISTVARNVITWLPIHSWSDEKVFSYLDEKGIPLHPVYSYLKRFSCRVCIFMTPADLTQVQKHDPEAITIIDDLEKEIGFTMKNGGPIRSFITS